MGTDMAKKRKASMLAKMLLETAGDMHKARLLDKATYDKVTARHASAAHISSRIKR